MVCAGGTLGEDGDLLVDEDMSPRFPSFFSSNLVRAGTWEVGERGWYTTVRGLRWRECFVGGDVGSSGGGLKVVCSGGFLWARRGQFVEVVWICDCSAVLCPAGLLDGAYSRGEGVMITTNLGVVGSGGTRCFRTPRGHSRLGLVPLSRALNFFFFQTLGSCRASGPTSLLLHPGEQVR
jgi:hypothetical protein